MITNLNEFSKKNSVNENLNDNLQIYTISIDKVVVLTDNTARTLLFKGVVKSDSPENAYKKAIENQIIPAIMPFNKCTINAISEKEYKERINKIQNELRKYTNLI